MARRALLVIDPQKVYTSRDSEMFCERAADTIERINQVVKDAMKHDDLVVLIRHVHKSDGSDLGRMFDFTGEPEEDINFKEGTEEVSIDGDLDLPRKIIELTKTRYSAFINTELDQILRDNKVNAVTICGFMTNFCCEATARHAHDLDYFVDFITDATGTPGTDKQTQAQLRERVSDTLAAGYSRTWNTKRWCARD